MHYGSALDQLPELLRVQLPSVLISNVNCTHTVNDHFDEPTKSLAQSVTRRAALKKFGVGLVGMALACFGLADRAAAKSGNCKPPGAKCQNDSQCCSGACFRTNFGNPTRICL